MDIYFTKEMLKKLAPIIKEKKKPKKVCICPSCIKRRLLCQMSQI